MLNVNVQDGPRELRAAVLAMRRADSTIRRDVSARLRTTMNPAWRTSIAHHLTGIPQERILLAGARIAAGNPPQLVTANSKRKTGRGGGLIPSIHWHAFEYGASNHTPRTYTRRNRGGTGDHRVTRNVTAGLPPRNNSGRVIGPAVAAILPRIAAFWAQSVVRAFMDAAEKKA